MSEKDNELNEILAGIRKEFPANDEMEKWRQAVQCELRPVGRKSVWASRSLQLVAAAFVGFLLGALIFRSAGFQMPAADIFAHNDATIEYSHVNLD